MDETVIDPERGASVRLHPLTPACAAFGRGYLSYGAQFSIRTNDPAFVERLVDVIPPLAQRSDGTGADTVFTARFPGPCDCGAAHGLVELFEGGRQIFTSADPGIVRLRLRTAIKMYVAEFARDRTFVHAGAVAWKGAGVVIVGPTMSGKTSLVSALLRRGADYLSDEYAVFDPVGALHAYRQPLAIRAPSQTAQRDEDPMSLGARTVIAPLPVRLVAVVDYVAGANWRPRTLSPGEAVLSLLEHAPAARSNSMRAIAALRNVVASAVVLQGDRGEADATAQQLLTILG